MSSWWQMSLQTWKCSCTHKGSQTKEYPGTKKASAKAAPCITQRYGCIAKGKGLPKATKAMKDQCHRVVVFSSKVEYFEVPANGEQRKVAHRPRIYEKSYPDSESVPKPDKLIAHRAQVLARQLQELVKLFGSESQPKCRFRCNDEDGGTKALLL